MNNYVDYLPGFSNSIFRIQHDTCFEKYRFEYNVKTLSYSDFRATRDVSDAVYNQRFKESENWLIFNWGYKTFYFAIIDKKTNHYKVFKSIRDPSCNCGSLLHFIDFVGDQILLEANNLNIKSILSVIDPNNQSNSAIDILNNLSGETELNEQFLITCELCLM